MRFVQRIGVFCAAGIVIGLATGAARASLGTPVSNLTVYYTTFDLASFTVHDPTVGAVLVNYDGNSSFSVILPPASGIPTFHFNTTSFVGADGIAIGSDGNVYVTNSSAMGVTQLTSGLSFVTNSATPGSVQPYHISQDPTSAQLYAAVANTFDEPGGAAVLQIANGLGTITSHPVVDNTPSHNPYNVTQIAYDSANGKWYYTVNQAGSDHGENGTFGTIDVSGSTFVATPLITGVNGIHGEVYDPFSQKFIVVGGNQVLEIDPTLTPVGNGSNLIVSSISEPGLVNDLDQGSVDGQGHIFIADANTGDMVFIDYSQTGLLATAGFSDTAFVATNIDDTAAPLIAIPLPLGLYAGLLLLGAVGLFTSGARRAGRAA